MTSSRIVGIEEPKSVTFLRHTLGLVYTLSMLAVGMATSVYFAMTSDAAAQKATQFHEAFFFGVYFTGTAAAVYLLAYLWRHRRARFHCQRRQIRMKSLALGSRLAGAALSPEDDAEGDAGVPYVAHCGEGFNLYLRAGLATFALGTAALDLLRMAALFLDRRQPACTANPFKAALYACQLAFVAASCGLLVLGHRAVFLRHRAMATALLGHQLAACLCVWAYDSVAEIAEAVLLAPPLARANATATAAALASEAVCPEQRRALGAAVPYLSPAVVEFALLAAPMTLQLLACVGDSRLAEARPGVAQAAAGEEEKAGVEEGSQGGIAWLSRRLNLRPTLRDLIGPAAGLAAFLTTLAVSACVLSLADHRAAALAYLGHTAALQAAAVCLTAAALCRLRRLDFVRAERHAFDDRLLIVAFFGALLYAVFLLCALLANAAAYPPELAAVEGLAGLLGVGQVVLQTPLLLDGLRRRVSGPGPHPGRGLIAALLGVNLSLWLLGTFESRRMDGVADALLAGRISVTGYRLAVHIGLPFAVLFRFHSGVCCSIIWDKAYSEEE